ncbi:MAG: META domain-containing protein [Xanthomonadales bacterium]|nr:META domain-containing protein [Xanthomonadales bacterium]
MSDSKASKRALTLALSLLLAIVAAACSRDDAPSLAQSVTDPVTGADTTGVGEWSGEWRLVAIDQRELSPGGTPSVVFGKEGECWGNTGVNDFRTTFSLEEMKHGRLKMGSAAVTRKAGPPEAMALERLFLERLEKARSYKVDGDLLYLHSGEDQNLTLQRVYQ